MAGGWRSAPRADGASCGVTRCCPSLMDYGMDLDAAIHQPRIDASEALS